MAARQKRQKISIEVVDAIVHEDASHPDEESKCNRFGDVLAHAIAEITCDTPGCTLPDHGTHDIKTWSVGVEMRSPITVRDRFYVVLDVDAKRFRDVGPMSADIADRLLAYFESGIEAGLPGSDTGTVSREIQDLTPDAVQGDRIEPVCVQHAEGQPD